MGPTILFDKSAIQSLSDQAVYEVGRYFYTVVPHVLLMEILADLSLDPNDFAASRAKVMQLAHKIPPTDFITNAHYHTICVHNLLGHTVPMHRKPAIGRLKPLVAKDGSKGLYMGVPPEEDAVLRWQNGQVNEDDLKFAIQYRETAKGANLEAMKQQLLKLPPEIGSLEQVAKFVDILLAERESQKLLLLWFLNLLRCDSQTRSRVCVRWKWAVDRSLMTFAPYAYHCLRVQLIYYTGMRQGLLSTRSTNIVDLEYLCYTPFAFVFCSGDKLHEQLAPFILEDDQSFVDREEMREALNEIVAARKDAANAEPSEDSLIRRLWVKHLGRFAPRVPQRPISEEQSKRIMEEVKPIIEALQEQDREREPKPRFPV